MKVTSTATATRPIGRRRGRTSGRPVNLPTTMPPTTSATLATAIATHNTDSPNRYGSSESPDQNAAKEAAPPTLMPTMLADAIDAGRCEPREE